MDRSLDRSLDRLADDIAALAADIRAATCRWLLMLAEFDRREGWAGEGCRTCAQWIMWRCGVGEEAAREYARVARRLDQLPLVRDAFSRSELTYSKVRAITRVADIEREAELVELARNTTAAQLERLVRAYRGVVLAEQDVQERFDERFLDWSVGEDGFLRLRGRLSPDQGATLVKALEASREELRENVSAETSGADAVGLRIGARNADALVQLAETGLAERAATSTGGDRFQIVVHVEAGRAALEDGTALPAPTVERLACDASLVRLTERDGVPLSVGRKTRSIPPSLRRALRSRDGCCQFPGCTQTRHVDAHHLHHWAHGGHTDLANLVQLCRHHHHLVHEGGFAIEGAPGSLVFRSPSGRRLRPGLVVRRGAHRPIPTVSAETVIQPIYERMDLGFTLDALLNFAPVPATHPPKGRTG
jgi:hypothetical protein